LVGGLLYRLGVVSEAMADSERTPAHRSRAAAAVLYVEEQLDAVPDSLGLMGLLDDDFALRVVLEDLDLGDVAHWSEVLATVWDDLPFLRGVNLEKDGESVALSWLDRLNSYLCYEHVLGRGRHPLLLLQPSTTCSMIHSIVTLMGLLVLDGLTRADRRLESLKTGQIYSIDGKFYARFDGLEDGGAFGGSLAGRVVRLRFKNGSQLLPARTIAHRMAPAGPGKTRLSPLMQSYSHLREEGDPIQTFFGWRDAIGAARVRGRLAVVAPRRRMHELIGGVESNGIGMTSGGLVRFLGTKSPEEEARQGLVLVVPSIGGVREVLEAGVSVSAVLVDGHAALYRDRHDLAFLGLEREPPPVIAWGPAGYFPSDGRQWPTGARLLGFPPAALTRILELDGEVESRASLHRRALWECATAPDVATAGVSRSPEESEVLRGVDEYISTIRKNEVLPEYWRYNLLSMAWRLRRLVGSTPALWSDLQHFAGQLAEASAEKWESLRAGAAAGVADVRTAESGMLESILSIGGQLNAKAHRLAEVLGANDSPHPVIVCAGAEQLVATENFGRAAGIGSLTTVRLSDLEPCAWCVVGGWQGLRFARRLWAHAPSSVLALADGRERQQWLRAGRWSTNVAFESALAAVGASDGDLEFSPRSEAVEAECDENSDSDASGVIAAGSSRRYLEPTRAVEAVLVWLADQTDCKVLAGKSRVVVEAGTSAREKVASALRPRDRILLGSGVRQWSPAEEFTEAVVEAVRRSNPDVVESAREWRLALARLMERDTLDPSSLRERLRAVGVSREPATIEGWLRLDRSSPIGPKGLRKEIAAIWQLVGNVATKDRQEVVDACRRLRSVRWAAGRALLRAWTGEVVDVGFEIDQTWLAELVGRVRQSVRTHEVVAVRGLTVPSSAIGCWLTPEMTDDLLGV